MNNGLHPELTNEQHHADPAMGSSGLRAISQTPLHFWAGYRDPERPPDDPTPAMILGTALHGAVLEPHRFRERYIAMPEGLDRRTKEGKALWADLVASGKEPMRAPDMQRIERMTTAIHRHPVTRVLWDQCAPLFECSMFWTDPQTGVQCKIRPDVQVRPGHQLFPNGLIVDVKTCDDASAEGFARSCWNLEMHIQAAFYPDGFMAVYGTEQPPAFVWMAVERDWPHAMKFYSAPDTVMAYGRREYRRLLDLYARCNAANEWPGYPTTVDDLVLPPWAAKVVEGVQP